MERLLITKIVRTGPTACDLYASKHKFKDLTLFDGGELAAVGVDFASLPIGQETPARFYALWQESTKLNTKGRPYRDVVGLEPVTAPATVASTDNSAILGELRRISALLEVIATAQGLTLPAPEEPDPEPNGTQDLDRAFSRYGDGSPVSDNPAELAAFDAHFDATGKPPADLGSLRAWTKARNGKR